MAISKYNISPILKEYSLVVTGNFKDELPLFVNVTYRDDLDLGEDTDQPEPDTDSGWLKFFRQYKQYIYYALYAIGSLFCLSLLSCICAKLCRKRKNRRPAQNNGDPQVHPQAKFNNGVQPPDGYPIPNQVQYPAQYPPQQYPPQQYPQAYY